MFTVSTDSPITLPRESRICAAVCSWPFLTALLNKRILMACSLGRSTSLSFSQSSLFQTLTLPQSSQAVVSETHSIEACSRTNWRVVLPSSWRAYNLWDLFSTSEYEERPFCLFGLVIGLLLMFSGKVEEATDLILLRVVNGIIT